MNTLKFNQYTNQYIITIQPVGYAFPYTFRLDTFKSALIAIARINEIFNIKVTLA